MSQRKLTRDTQNRMFGGVCAGFANQFGWDPSVVRFLAAVSLVISFGTTLLVYLILWAIIPKDISLYPPTIWQEQAQPLGESDRLYHQ